MWAARDQTLDELFYIRTSENGNISNQKKKMGNESNTYQ